MKDFDTNSDFLKHKYIQEFIREENDKKRKIQEIFSDNNYVEWLCRFTLDNSIFSEDDWLYFTDKLSQEDKLHLQDFKLFFEGLKAYADKNFIYPVQANYNVYYLLNYNGVNFKIGITFGQGASYFCERTELSKNAINFSSILSSVENHKTELIKNKLEKLSNVIRYLISIGIPEEAIIETVNGAINMASDKTNTEFENKSNKIK